MMHGTLVRFQGLVVETFSYDGMMAMLKAEVVGSPFFADEDVFIICINGEYPVIAIERKELAEYVDMPFKMTFSAPEKMG